MSSTRSSHKRRRLNAEFDEDDAGPAVAGKSSSEKESTTCELSEQAEIVKNSLLQNIRIVNSSNSKFTDSYIGISSLINSFKKYKDTYDGGEGKTGLTFNE